jgi:CBS domain-containing protein
MRKEYMLAGQNVGQIREYRVTNLPTIEESLPLTEIMSESAATGKDIHNIYVIDKQKRLIGSISAKQLIEYIFPMTAISEHSRNSGLGWTPRVNAGVAGDIMNKVPVSLKDTDSLATAARLLMREGVSELPVVDDHMHLIGVFTLKELIAAYQKVV